MEQFQIKDESKYLSINNSPIKLAIDINNVLPALNFHSSRFRKYRDINFEYITSQYIPRNIYLFGMNNPYIIVIIEYLRTTRKIITDIIVNESGSIVLAIFKVDTLDTSKKVITDISPHGLIPLFSGYNICGCIYTTCECIDFLRGKRRCCGSPGVKKKDLFRYIHKHTSIVFGVGCQPKLKFPVINAPSIQHDINHIAETIIEITDNANINWYINYKTISMLDANTWFGYTQLLESSGLPPELQSSILHYC